MFYIKLDNVMHLVVTQREPIYRGDNLSRKVIYLIPLKVGEIDPLVANFYLSYIRADGVADVIALERMEEKYNETYYQYTFPEFVNFKLTKYAGEVCTWLQIYSGDPSNPTVAKSGECVLQVQDSKNMDNYLCDHQMTALYQFHRDLQETVSEVENTVQEVHLALDQKADDILYNVKDGTLQLAAHGKPIGNKVVIKTIDGAVVTNAGITVDGELIVAFSDGTIKNLGNVVGKGGGVYVPHVSDRKILTFTVEENPDGVPEPVDLNPFDEWSHIDDGKNPSDYIWESM